MLTRLWFLPIVLSLGTGCSGVGSASIEGDIGGYSFDFNTIFAWIDAKERDVDMGNIIYKNRELKVLNVRFTGASFDPEVDQRFATPEEKIALANDENIGGSLDISITAYDRVSGGSTLMAPPPAISGADTPSLLIDYSFALRELDAEEEYPGQIASFGSDATATLTMNEAGTETGATIAGKLTLNVVRDDNDPANAQTGSMTIEFDAPIIAERIAECNAGRSSACEIDRPPDP